MRLPESITSFICFWGKFRRFLPLVWPRDFMLKVNFVLCFLIVGVSNLINVYTPIYSKRIVDSMTSKDNGDADYRWDLICIYIFLKYANIISYLRRILWKKVEVNIQKEVDLMLFSHIHNLSLRWHLNRKTGEIVKIMDSASSNVNLFISQVSFELLECVLETVANIGYLSIFFDVWFGISICICYISYIGLQIFGGKIRIQSKRDEREAAYKAKNRSIDSLLNFETVKYFGNEKYETGTFQKTLTLLYSGRIKSALIQFSLTCTQNFLVDVSLLIGTLICVYKVIRTKELTMGDYVLFSNCGSNIFHMIPWCTYLFSSIQSCMVEFEDIFKILDEEPEVEDVPNAPNLMIHGGHIEFKNVFFEYVPNKPVLKNISFSVLPGETVALVGQSGSGKSTVLKLLFRFYDTHSGSIAIDGQCVKDITQESLREAIGVVPQDSVLFDSTIRYNIQYGNFSASEEELFEAARGAEIHDKILTFENGYDTVVGERGLKLSGGEKQRVSIARVLLKAPQIVLLDEATSSLDTETERNIQASLHKMCSNRSTIIVAHRLSTIIHADQILVMKEGTIVERGSHKELLEIEGMYATMWRKQLGLDGTREVENIID